jgi:DNA-binding XRE family transcriptional regulator
MSTLTAGPWYASEPNPSTGACVITNSEGRVVAAMVPNRADADFICQARAAHVESGSIYIDWRAFGRAVQAARKDRRMTQDVAAEMCGISRNYMSMIERGAARDPGYTIVLTLCMWLGLEMPQATREGASDDRM